MQANWLDVFTRRLEIDPAGDLDAQLAKVPAKWVVYLMCDAEDRPVQLLCVKNLRYSLKRRLGMLDEPQALTKRINYRELIRHIHWRRVDSRLEADWIYYETARLLFPESYQGMLGFNPAWFIHVDPDADFPRYVKTTNLTREKGVYLGPLEDKHAAGNLIELLEDAFDLCRYYDILVQAPHGRACAYKEMGKCPAPCDGSISLPQYRRMIEWSANTAIDPAEMIREQEARMSAAAAELKFESAAKIKNHIDQLSQLGSGPFRHVAFLKDFVYVSLQRGPRAGTAKLLLITPGGITHLISLITEPQNLAEILRLVLEHAQARENQPVDKAGIERMGIVANLMFSPKIATGVFLPLRSIDEKSLMKAYRELRKQKVEPETDQEGVTKELQAL